VNALRDILGPGEVRVRPSASGTVQLTATGEMHGRPVTGAVPDAENETAKNEL